MDRMSDLISRKDFITEMEINIGNIYNPEIIKGMKFAMELIKSRPTAFDKEKVIEELKTTMGSAQLAQSLVGTNLVQCGGFSYGYYNGVKDAIEIVEKGGIK